MNEVNEPWEPRFVALREMCGAKPDDFPWPEIEEWIRKEFSAVAEDEATAESSSTQ